MTRNKEAARSFWLEVDKRMIARRENLYDIARSADVPYKSILSWRSKHLFPDVETVFNIAKGLMCSMDELMGDSAIGSNSSTKEYLPYIERCPAERLESVRVLLGMPEKKNRCFKLWVNDRLIKGNK